MHSKGGHVDFLQIGGLDGVDNDGEERVCTSLEKLLGVDIDSWQPAAKAGMWVIPSDEVVCADAAGPLGVGWVFLWVPAMRV